MNGIKFEQSTNLKLNLSFTKGCEGMYNTIIIGAGQAGLAMGYYLKQMNQSFLILDKKQEVGEVWDKRYDSLVLFTPRSFSALPGLKLNGDAQGFPTKDEISQYLKAYAQFFKLPIKYGTNITSVQKKNNIYYILTEEDLEYEAENIVIATGPFQKPRIPSFANKFFILISV